MFLFKLCCREPESPPPKNHTLYIKPITVNILKTPNPKISPQKHDHHSGQFLVNKKDRYEGQQMNGKPHGNGSMLFANGDFYRGQWVMGVKEGRGLQIYQELCFQYEGQWQKNVPYGNGKITNPNQSYYIGEFQNGKKHGKGLFHDFQKKKIYDQIYQNGILKQQAQIQMPKSKEEEFFTLVLDKQRFVTQDLHHFQDANPKIKQFDLGFLLKYYCLSKVIKLEFINKNIKDWTIKEVIDFLDAINLKAYRQIFYKNKVKGKDLVTLSQKEMQEDLKMKLGDRKRFSNYIAFLTGIQKNDGLISFKRKNSKQGKKHTYKLRSATSMKKVLKNVTKNLIYQQSIKQLSSQSEDSETFKTNQKFRAIDTFHSEEKRQYIIVALAHSLAESQNSYDKKSIQQQILSQRNSERSKKSKKNGTKNFKDTNDLMSGSPLTGKNNRQYQNNLRGDHKFQKEQPESETQQFFKEQHKSSNINLKEPTIPNELQRKKTHVSNHQHTQIRQLYQFLKEHRSLDFLVKEKDIQKLEQIGEGGYGKVYKAKYIGSLIAVKDYMKTGTHHHKQDFMKQVEVISDLKHPNIVLYMGMCITANKYTLITEYLENGSLFDQLHKKKKKFTTQEKVGIIDDIVKAMVYLHNMKNIVHRDLKSSNVLIGQDWKVKLCDFGLSGQRKKNIIKNKNRMGTYQWMAPEVIRNEQIDFFSDVYSFGMIIWELLTQKIPYDGLAEQQIIGLVGFDENHDLQLPRGNHFLISIMKKCLKKKPPQRPTFMQIQKDLNHYVQEISGKRDKQLTAPSVKHI